MERVENKLWLSDSFFKRNIGTPKFVFQEMLAILQTAYAKRHKSGDNPRGGSVDDQLLITLQLRQRIPHDGTH